MITREVREWLDKVKRNQYSYNDAMIQFSEFARFLSKEEILLLRKRIEESYKQ